MPRAIVSYRCPTPLRMLHSVAQDRVEILKSFEHVHIIPHSLSGFHAQHYHFPMIPKYISIKEKKSEIYVSLEGNYEPN